MNVKTDYTYFEVSGFKGVRRKNLRSGKKIKTHQNSILCLLSRRKKKRVSVLWDVKSIISLSFKMLDQSQNYLLHVTKES